MLYEVITLAQHGEPLDPLELKDHRCLHYGYQSSGSQWKLAGPKGEHTYAINCIVITSYSIHYTKLYESIGEFKAKPYCLRDQPKD